MSRARDLANSADNDISGTLTVDDITLSGNITVGGTVDGRDLATDGSKLDGIESGATADQTKADIDALNINADTLDGQHGSYYTSYADTAVANLVDSAPGTLDTLNELAAALGDDPNFSTTVTNNIATKLPLAGGTMTGAITFAAGQTFDGRDVSADGAKLDGIEANATADQTAAEIRALVEAATDSNVFTDADHTKLNGIESGATADQTITAGSGLTGGGTGNVTLSHADTSSQASVNNSGATVIQDVTVDTYGHVTGLGSKTMTLADLGYTGATNANYITNNNQLTNGAGYTTFTANQSLDTSSSPTFSNPNLTSALRMGGTQVLSSGRALTNISSIDATTAAAIGAAGVGGGGEIEVTAHPNGLSAGDLVGIDSNGKAKAIQPLSITDPLLSATPACPDSSSVNSVHAYLNGAGTHVVVFYQGLGSGRRQRAICGAINSDGSVSWGSSWYDITSTESAGAGYGSSGAFLQVGNDKFVNIYTDANGYHYARVIDRTSGTTLSVGSAYSLGGTGGQYDPIRSHQAATDGNGKVVYCWHHNNSDRFGGFIVSGQTITQGGTYTSHTGGPGGWYCVAAYSSYLDKFIVVTNPSTSSSTHFIGTVNSNGTMSYTTTSHSHYASISSGWHQARPFCSGQTLVLPEYNRWYQINSNSTTTYLGSGTALSSYTSEIADLRSKANEFAYLNINFGNYSATIDFIPKTITVGTQTVTNGTTTRLFEGDYGYYGYQWNNSINVTTSSLDDTKIMIPVTFYDSADIRISVLTSDVYGSVAGSYIGISQGNYSGNTTATIAISGGESNTQTGLTAGKGYKLNFISGQLEAALDPADVLLVATSSTNVIIR